MPAEPPSTAAALGAPLPLFPLGTVFFPGAHLGLKVFESRYLDLISDCMRSNQPFGVICLRQGADHGPQKSLLIESVGVLAHIDLVDAERPGILRVSCTGGKRFRLVDKPVQRENGLWTARGQLMPDDPARQPGAAMLQTVSALAEAIRKLQNHEQSPFSPPYRLDDAGWVANRWCELLPVSLSAKQKLMELDDPVIRLSLVDGFLRDKKVVVG